MTSYSETWPVSETIIMRKANGSRKTAKAKTKKATPQVHPDHSPADGANQDEVWLKENYIDGEPFFK